MKRIRNAGEQIVAQKRVDVAAIVRRRIRS